MTATGVRDGEVVERPLDSGAPESCRRYAAGPAYARHRRQPKNPCDDPEICREPAEDTSTHHESDDENRPQGFRRHSTRHALRLAFRGAQAAVVFPDGTVWRGASGEANRQTGAAVKTETRFAIGSVTKLFAAAVVLRLAEPGGLALDDKVVAWVPDEDVDGRVTIRQVLGHTGGLPGLDSSICESGTSIDYSNVGYGLLGRVIEAVTADTFAQAYRTEILDQLGLTATVLGTKEVVDGPQATGYAPDGPLNVSGIGGGAQATEPRFAELLLDRHGRLWPGAGDRRTGRRWHCQLVPRRPVDRLRKRTLR